MMTVQMPELGGAAYTSLMKVYNKQKDPVSVQALIRQKEEAGYVVVPADYTILMDCLNKCDRHREALQLYKSLSSFEKDEFMMIAAISSCSKLYEAEYALKIWNTLSKSGFSETTYPYNEIIMALAKRTDYAEKAVELWRKMIFTGVPLDFRTFNGALTACSRMGDLALAKEVLAEMKLHDVDMDETRYSLVLRTYAAACQVAGASEHDLYIEDSWLIYKEAVANLGQPTSTLINSLLTVHCRAHREHEVEGLVLPLFESHGIARTMQTYRALIGMYNDLNSPEAVYNLWELMLSEGVKPDIFTMNAYLRTTIKDDKLQRVVEVLEMMKVEEKKPNHSYLRVLREVKEMPYSLWKVLQNFKDFHFNSWSKRRTYNVTPKRFFDQFTR
jgi:pentatricopeptide repeat protein